MPIPEEGKACKNDAVVDVDDEVLDDLLVEVDLHDDEVE